MAINGQLSIDSTSTIGTTTNGSTSVNIYSATAFLANDGAQTVTFDIVGMDFDNDEVASAKILVRLKNVSGTPSIIGSPIHIVPFAAGSSTGLINCSASVSISGANIRVNVIGVTDRTIKWTCNRVPALSILDPWTAAPTPGEGYVQSWNNTTGRWEAVAIGGDVTGSPASLTVVKIQNRAVASTAPTDGYVLAWDNGNSQWKPSQLTVAGDLSGTTAAATVVKIQNRTVETAAPSDGYVLTWDNGDSEWQAKQVGLSSLVGPVKANVADPINIDYTVDSLNDGKDYLLVAQTSGITITLPTATAGRTLVIKNASGSTITVARGGASRIDNVASDYTMSVGSKTFIYSTYNSNWWIAS
jgi:hypothetical protein